MSTHPTAFDRAYSRGDAVGMCDALLGILSPNRPLPRDSGDWTAYAVTTVREPDSGRESGPPLRLTQPHIPGFPGQR